MSRKATLTMTLTGSQGAGKTAIAEKLCAYLEFFEITSRQTDEHTYVLSFDQAAIKRLQEAR